MKVRVLVAVLAPLGLVALGLAASELLAGLREEPAKAAAGPPLPLVRVGTPVLEEVRFSVTAHGEVVPPIELDLVAEVAGKVTFVAPDLAAGGFFEEGDVLLAIDPRDYELALSRAELELARARRRLAEEEAAAEAAAREWRLLGRGEGTPLALREPQLAEARAEAAAARGELELRQRDLERTELRAPFAGRVRRRDVAAGQYVTRGQPLARVYAIDHVEVRLPIPDEELAFLDLSPGTRPGAGPGAGPGNGPPGTGPEVTLRARFAGREREWSGRIVRTEGTLDPRTRMVVAVARVDDPYGRGQADGGMPLAVGMFVSAEIEGNALPGVLTLPREALRGPSRVYVVDAGRLAFRQVEVLRAGRERIVIGAGLALGEHVVLSPLELATDGMAVRVEGRAGEGPP